MAKDRNTNAPMTDDELLHQIREEVAAADYSGTNELSFQREQSTRAYNGVLTDGLQPTTGMSSMVNNKVQPAIETLTTYLTKVFCSDKETVVFNPTNPQLAQAAKQITNMVNYVIHKQNDGYKVLNRWIKDAAINKNGIVKISWDQSEFSYKEEYKDISEDELAAIILQKEQYGYTVEILEQSSEKKMIEVANEETGESIEVEQESNTVIVKCSHPKGMPKIENVPPEEFLINEGATDINNDPKCRFVCQRMMLSVSDVKKMFPDVNEEDLLGAGAEGYLEYEYERLNRHAHDGTYDYTGTDPSAGPLRLIEITESWIKADMDGDGIAEWRHTISAGNVLLQNEEWFGDIPFASFCFFPIPHKFYGLSVYDKIQAYHRAASMILRSEVDTRLQANTFRLLADDRNINIRDLQSGRPGIIRVKPGFEPSQVMPIPTPAVNGHGIQVLEYIRQEIIGQIGIDPVTGAISTDVEKSGNDAAKTGMVVDNASAKIEMYSREFAETGLRDVVWQISKLLLDHSNDISIMKLAEKITPGTPFILAQEGMTEYFDKDDITAKVGLGHLSNQQKMQGITQIQVAQQQLAAMGIQVSPDKQLNATYEMSKALGYENINDFFPTMEEVQAQIQAQAQSLALQQQAAAQQQQQLIQLEMMKAQADIAKTQSETAENVVDAQVKGDKQALEEEKAAWDIKLTQEAVAAGIPGAASVKIG